MLSLLSPFVRMRYIEIFSFIGRICVILAFGISNLAFAEERENEEKSRAQINEVFNIEDYARETHIDAPDDINAKNAHIERSLEIDEKNKYYENPLAYMEKLAQTNWQRALELSMYYQGWKPNTIFLRFDFEMRENGFNYIPTTDDMRFKNRQTRNQKKAIAWAEKAFELANARALAMEEKLYYNYWDGVKVCAWNLFYRYDEYEFPNKKEKIASLVKQLEESKLDKNFTYEISSFKKNGCVWSKNMNEEKRILANEITMDYWRNYYCGFFTVKDKKFYQEMLFNFRRSQRYFFYDVNLSFMKIYSGLYDKDEYIPMRAKAYAEIATGFKNLTIAHTLERLNENPHNFSTYIFPLSRYAIKNFRIVYNYSCGEIIFENPHYNKAKAFEELKKNIEFYKKENLRREYPIFQFIDNAPRWGISEKDYNDILAEIKKDKRFFNYDKECSEEKAAREWFSGRLPSAKEYR